MIRALLLGLLLWVLCTYHGQFRAETVVTRVTGPELLRRPGGKLSVAGVCRRWTAKPDGSVTIRLEAQGVLVNLYVAPLTAIEHPVSGESVEAVGTAIAPGVLSVEDVRVIPALEGAPREKLQVLDSGMSEHWSRSGKTRYVWLHLRDGTRLDKVLVSPDCVVQGPGVAIGVTNARGQFVLESWVAG